jgi:Gas vesicle synthesis protein GvpL/GvpF
VPRSEDSFERLRAAIDELAAADAADLLAEARIEARARVRGTLTDALAHSMLERLHEELEEPAPPPRPAPAPAPALTAEPAWYVYGVVGSDTELSGELTGVAGARAVALLSDGSLAAVTSQVPLDEFDEARLREHLADMAWVEATARAHEAVLDRVRAQATVIPMRMCTVYRTEGGVREMLRREAEPLLEAIDHLHGKAEWGIKAFIDLDHGAGGAGDESGAAYMQRKREERTRHEHAVELAEEVAGLIHERLAAVVSDGLLIPLQRREVSGHRGDMVFNGVYLVADDETDAFHEAVRTLRAELEPEGFDLIPTGPWPAYNFVPGTIGATW